MPEYWKTYIVRYASADAEKRRASREHWQHVHIENIKNGADLALSSSILAAISIVDSKVV